MDCCVFQIIFNLAVSLLMLSLTVSGTTNKSAPDCAPQLKVPRNTMVKAPVMKLLKINCTVTQPHGCHERPIISWCIIYGDDCRALNYSNYITTDWKETTQDGGMAFLIFLNISVEDEGLYRCRGGEFTVSHTINVTVTDNQEEVSRNQNKTLGDQNPSLKWLWPYVYICSGIAALVFIIITVTLLIIRSQGSKSTRKDMTTKNQYIEAPRSDLPPPPVPQHRQNSRSSSEQQTSASYRGCETPPVRGTPSLAGRVSDGSRNTAGRDGRGEEHVLVYASLNHQAMPRGPRRAPPREPEPELEPSEYAAIRFR